MSRTTRWSLAALVILGLVVSGLALAGRRPPPRPLPRQSSPVQKARGSEIRLVKPGRSATYIALHQEIPRHPVKVLRHLLQRSSTPGGVELKGAEHQALFSKGVDRLGRLSQTTAEPWLLLHSIRFLRPQVWPTGAEGTRGRDELTSVVAQGLRRTLQDGVFATVALGEKKAWLPLATRARQWLAQDTEFYQAVGWARSPECQEARQVLQAIGKLEPRALAVDRLERLLEKGKTTTTQRTPWRDLDLQVLPEKMRPLVGGLRAVAELEASPVSWQPRPSVPELVHAVQELEQAIQNLPAAQQPRELGTRVRQQLAVRAFLAGDSRAAEQLWPAADAAGAAAVLRDMKALLTGRGELTTPLTAASQDGQILPPGLRPLLPEASVSGWRPPARGAATAGLPPLEEAARVVEPLRQQVAGSLEQERTQLATSFQPHLRQLQQLHQQYRARAAQDLLLRQQLAARLRIPLRPAAWLWALEELRKKRRLEDLVATLTADHKNADLDERLERTLSYLESARVDNGLRQHIRNALQGRSVADVVVELERFLKPSIRAAGGEIRFLVQLDEVLAQLDPAPHAFEYAQAEQWLAEGLLPDATLGKLRAQRRQEKVRHDLDRAQAYLERPLQEDELKTATTLLNKGQGVADVVAAFPEAVAPARRALPGGLREAVLLDEVNQQLEPPLSANEFVLARRLLRGGQSPEDVVTVILLQRPDQVNENE